MAEVISAGVGMRDDVRGHVMTAKLAKDPPPGQRSTCVDEHASHEIGVDGVGCESPELVNVWRQDPHVMTISSPIPRARQSTGPPAYESYLSVRRNRTAPGALI